MEVLQLGPLRVRRVVIGTEKPAKSTSERSKRGVANGDAVIVLMHGFGAPGTDLVALGEELDVPPGTTFLFPEAHIDLASLVAMPIFGGSRAWWMIDMDRLQQAISRGEMRDLPREIPEGLPDARAKVIAMLDALELADDTRLVLGGFSQGAMLALDVALHTKRPLAGVVELSGTLLAEDEWRPLMASRRGLDVFQSHGIEDPILPFALAERLHADLLAAGLRVDFHSFRGGHTIPAPVLRDLGAWLRDRLS